MIRNTDLLDIIKGARLLVKRLRKRDANVLAGQFEQVIRMATALCKRRDLLLPAYRAEVMRIQHKYNRLMQEASDRYPGVAKRRPPAAPTEAVVPPAPSKALTVHITLPDDQWLFISQRVASGFARSKADYFRTLHNREVGRHD